MERIQKKIDELRSKRDELRKNLAAFSQEIVGKNDLSALPACPICGCKANANKVIGPEDSPFSDTFFSVYYTCGHYERIQMELKRTDAEISSLLIADRLYERCNLGEKFVERTFENFNWKREPKAYEACIKYARGFLKYARGGKGLLLASSQYGNGKTHLAGAIIHEVIERHLASCIFTRGVDMVTDVQHALWNKPIRFRVQDYERCDLLVIDDIAKEGVSAATAKVYWRIVDYRVLNNKPMVLTTNYSEETLISACTDPVAADTWGAVVDRLAAACKPVVFQSGSYRRSVEAKVA